MARTTDWKELDRLSRISRERGMEKPVVSKPQEKNEDAVGEDPPQPEE